MLVLTRKPGESLVMQTPDGVQITVTVCDVERGRVRLGIDAPREVIVMRSELETPKETT